MVLAKPTQTLTITSAPAAPLTLALDGAVRTVNFATVHNPPQTQQQIVTVSLLLTAPNTPSFSKSARRLAVYVLIKH